MDFVISPFLSTSSFYHPGHLKNLRLCTFAWVEVPKSVFRRGGWKIVSTRKLGSKRHVNGQLGGMNDVVSADLELLGIQRRGYSFAL